MRYHIIVQEVPDASSVEQHLVIDEEFDSDRPLDEALIEWAADWHDSEELAR